MKLKLYLSYCWIILSMNGWQVHAQNDLSFQSLFKTEKGKEVACYRIPALTTAPNGDLIAAINERVPSCGDLKWNRNINIVIKY